MQRMTRIGIIAEVHMRTKYATALETELQWVGDHLANNFDPDHLFVLGDVIQHSETADEDLKNIRRVARTLSEYSYPVTYLLGNHDVIHLTREQLSTSLNQDSFFGEIPVGDHSIVYLDSSMRNTETPSGMVGPEQLAFVEDVISRVDDALVLLHHPVGDFDLSDNYWFADFPEQAYLCDRKRLLEIMNTHGNVRSTISGHIHHHRNTEFHEVPHLSIGAFSKETPDKPITGTYAELQLGDPNIANIKVRDRTIGRYEF